MTTKKNNRRPDKSNRETDLDNLTLSSPPAFDSFYIQEPKLVFGGNLSSVDPKTGIEQFGPFASIKSRIRIGVIGTGTGIDAFRLYLERAQQPIRPGLNSRGKHYDSLYVPDFPGVNASSSFRCNFVTELALQRAIPEGLYENAVKPLHPSVKLKQVVDLIVKELEALSDTEPEPDVVAVIMPPIVEKECATVGAAFRGTRLVLTPVQQLEKRLERLRRKTGQDFLPFDFGDSPVDGQKGYWNIHHALKAHAMKFGFPTQIIWERRLRGEGLTQDPASMAWNLFTALYYKAGNIPWQLQHVPPNTCFIGVSFYKDSPTVGADIQTSLAQVFSGSGEGLVLKGQKAVIDKKRDRYAHLDELSAQQLMKQALGLYEQHHHTKPSRVVVHKTSRYWPEELAGFKKGLDDIYSYDFLALEKLGTRFMRLGKEPPARGTVVDLARRHHVIFTVGYVPYYRAYPGMRIPNPVEIVEHHGDSPTEQICSEVMALTKLNWNSSSFASSEPITILFARTVGRILAELPSDVTAQTKYRFYM
jgi:hypothetical protein